MKILLVEDDAMHVSYLREIVQQALPEADEILIATNGREGETKARENKIESIVMDLRMAERNGIEAARTIWAERPGTKILFWSNYSDEAYLRGIARIVPERAAYGYILKTASESRMQLALRSVLIESQIVVDREIHQIQNRQHRSSEALTDNELTVLLDVALGLPDKTIASRRNISLRTVQNRLLALYDKLDVSSIEEGETEIALNKRVRAVSHAITAQIINAESIKASEKEFLRWLRRKELKNKSGNA